jgi:hypothetical protein
MKAFIWTVIVILALEIIGKALMLKDGDHLKPRSPGMMCADIAAGVMLITWGAFVLGAA